MPTKKTAKKTTAIRVGDVLRDNDPRMGHRTMKVVEVRDDRVICDGPARRTSIAINRIFDDGKERRTGFARVRARTAE